MKSRARRQRRAPRPASPPSTRPAAAAAPRGDLCLAAGADAQRGQHPLVVAVGGGDDDGQVRRLGGEPSGGLDAVQARHAEVHQHHVGVGLGSDGVRLLAFEGGADDVDAVDQAEQHLQALADHARWPASCSGAARLSRRRVHGDHAAVSARAGYAWWPSPLFTRRAVRGLRFRVQAQLRSHLVEDRGPLLATDA